MLELEATGVMAVCMEPAQKGNLQTFSLNGNIFQSMATLDPLPTELLC